MRTGRDVAHAPDSTGGGVCLSAFESKRRSASPFPELDRVRSSVFSQKQKNAGQCDRAGVLVAVLSQKTPGDVIAPASFCSFERVCLERCLTLFPVAWAEFVGLKSIKHTKHFWHVATHAEVVDA